MTWPLPATSATSGFASPSRLPVATDFADIAATLLRAKPGVSRTVTPPVPATITSALPSPVRSTRHSAAGAVAQANGEPAISVSDAASSTCTVDVTASIATISAPGAPATSAAPTSTNDPPPRTVDGAPKVRAPATAFAVLPATSSRPPASAIARSGRGCPATATAASASGCPPTAIEVRRGEAGGAGAGGHRGQLRECAGAVPIDLDGTRTGARHHQIQTAVAV